MDNSMLVACTACAAKISRKAYSCPTCGHPNERITRQLWLLTIALAVVAALVMGWRVHAIGQRTARAEATLMHPLLNDYGTLKKTVNLEGTCQQATLIAALYQENNSQARFWRERAQTDCERAGTRLHLTNHSGQSARKSLNQAPVVVDNAAF